MTTGWRLILEQTKDLFFILDIMLLRFSVILVGLEIEQVKVPAFKIITS